MKRHARWIVLTLGLAWSLVLCTRIQEGVFYNGDGGLKALMIRQFAEVEVARTLELPHEPWEEDLWDAGLFPFAPPFVEESPEGRRVAFPQLFLLLSAPAYRLLGYAGLYLIPLLSVWLLWWTFARTTRRLGLSPVASTAALACLVFASPLTLYGAILWEHSLAAWLVFLGVAPVFAAGDEETSGASMPATRAALLGLGTGLAAWIRSEAAVLAAGLALVAGRRWLRARRARDGAFCAGVLLAGGTLIAVNLSLYGNLFGVESGLFEWESAGARFGKILTAQSARLVTHHPPVLLALLGLPLLLRRRDGRTLFALALGFFLVVPLFLPNGGGKQWGPRYVLPLLPLVSLLVGYVVDSARARGRSTGRLAGLALIGTLGAGALRNVYQGTQHLAEDYRERTRPALAAVLESDVDTVLVNSQTIAQELASAFGPKRFFRTRDVAALQQAGDALVASGRDRLLFLTRPRAAFRPTEGELRFPAPRKHAAAISFEPLGEFGSYEIWEATLAAD